MNVCCVQSLKDNVGIIIKSELFTNIMNVLKSILILLVLFTLPNIAECQNIPNDLNLKSLDNRNISLGDVIGKEVTIVAFWATWCKPCQNELEALMDLHGEWKNKVKVLAVSIDDARSVAKVKSLVKGKKWPYQVLLDSNKKLYKALNLTSIPFIMIVSDGKVIWSHVGYMPGDEELVVKKALEEWTQHFNKK